MRSCLVCQKVKFDRYKAQGLLEPLPILTCPWESIAIDFIFDLLRTHSGHDGIWSVIDRSSKQRPQIYEFVLKGNLGDIGTRLQFSSSFHPQIDGQSEIANLVVLDLLKSYISDQNTQWEKYLPLVEFAYNNTKHFLIGKAPFEIVEGAIKVPLFLSTNVKIFEADEYIRDLDTTFAKVRETLQKSQERQKKAADRHRHDLKLKENDLVLLRFEKARLRKKKGKESGPILALVLEQDNAVAKWRVLIGPTDPKKAQIEEPNSIRALYGSNTTQNCVHGSDTIAAANREIMILFGDVQAGAISS
ncbi:hypothetical protein L7F22_034583 [Adiantum nelumboides]|nr:hypothetical protein [Adiantum nelumboides]